jgi:hypothetical protein
LSNRFAERVIFGFLPTDADAEPHAASRQRVERADLFGDQHGLPLRQDQHFSAKTDLRRHRGAKAKRHERFENRHLRRILQPAAAVDRVAHDDVIEHVEFVVPDPFDLAGQALHGRGALARNDRGKVHCQFHQHVSQ